MENKFEMETKDEQTAMDATLNEHSDKYWEVPKEKQRKTYDL